MEMHQVESSNISEVGHAGDTMHVKYKNGHTYSFNGVSAEDFKKLKSAKSVGKHLNGMGLTGKRLKG